MQYVSELTNNRIRLGAGTLYGSISKMEKEEQYLREMSLRGWHFRFMKGTQYTILEIRVTNEIAMHSFRMAISYAACNP
jgi:hypothetical protein